MSFASYLPFPRSKQFTEIPILTQGLYNSIITQIALQLTSAHSYGGRGRVGRNENVTGVKAILRISMAKLVFGFCRIT